MKIMARDMLSCDRERKKVYVKLHNTKEKCNKRNVCTICHLYMPLASSKKKNKKKKTKKNGNFERPKML